MWVFKHLELEASSRLDTSNAFVWITNGFALRKRLCVLHRRPGHGEEKNLFPCWKSDLSRTAYRTVTILTERVH